MDKYGQIAVNAAQIAFEAGMQPEAAWQEAAAGIYPESESGRDKGCPRSAFLGLCQDGLVLGTPAGAYTRSRDNRRYALDAVRLLRMDPKMSEARPDDLWLRLMDGIMKRHNSQMDVVLSLWQHGWIR